jgi:oxalate---CoA ligase
MASGIANRVCGIILRGAQSGEAFPISRAACCRDQFLVASMTAHFVRTALCTMIVAKLGMSIADSEPSLFSRIECRAASAPRSVALCAPGRTALNYAQLCERISTIASTFGECAGQVVAIFLPDPPDLIVAVLGTSFPCLSAPINSGLPAPELEACLIGLSPAALIVETGNIEATRVADHLGIPVWELGAAGGSAAGVFELVRRGARMAPPARPTADPGLLLHTSATTGRPKQVPLSHANLRAQCLQTSRALQLGETDRFLSMMPLFHLQGILAIFSQLYVGGTAICTPGFDAATFLDWLHEFKPTWYTAGPTLHRAILTLLDGGQRVLPCDLRFVRSIGAPLPPDLIAELEKGLAAPVIEGYGMTEVGAATSNPLPPARRKPGSVGVSTGAEVAIFSDSGHRLDSGKEGEIRIRGAAVTNGYRNDDAANAASFADGWLRTGDLGRFDEEGYLYISGRVKELVNRGGEKIMPQEIDAVLASHPGVADAAVFGIPHPTLGEDLVAAVISRPGADLTETHLREFTAMRMAAFKVPRRILFVGRIPKSATGKPQRSVLREELGAIAQRACLRGASELEVKLADIWKRILHAEVGLDDDFFAAGGDSLAATIMLAEVRSALAVSPALLDRFDFFENPTVGSLARIVSECGATGEAPQSALVALQSNGFHRPLFLMPDATSEPYYLRHVTKYLGKDMPAVAIRYPSANGAGRTVEQLAAHCLKVIRTAQPKGPYRIAGHCFGGIVAFETARQLLSCGEDVDLLALMDATTPGYPKPHAHWRRYARTLRAIVTRDPESKPSSRQILEHVQFLLARAQLVLGARWRRRLEVMSVAFRPLMAPEASGNEIAGRNYRPHPVPVRAVQFIAVDQAVDTKVLDDPRLEWRRFALRGFTSYQVPGDHFSMFAEPNVRHLVGHLQVLISPGEVPR